jgi:hypothetical protein
MLLISVKERQTLPAGMEMLDVGLLRGDPRRGASLADASFFTNLEGAAFYRRVGALGRALLAIEPRTFRPAG